VEARIGEVQAYLESGKPEPAVEAALAEELEQFFRHARQERLRMEQTP
jgi:hypothetical protein